MFEWTKWLHYSLFANIKTYLPTLNACGRIKFVWFVEKKKEVRKMYFYFMCIILLICISPILCSSLLTSHTKITFFLGGNELFLTLSLFMTLWKQRSCRRLLFSLSQTKRERKMGKVGEDGFVAGRCRWNGILCWTYKRKGERHVS